MEKIRILSILMGIVLLFPSTVHAQGLDPGRVLAIKKASREAKKTLEAQLKAQGLQTAGHMWTKEEIEEAIKQWKK